MWHRSGGRWVAKRFRNLGFSLTLTPVSAILSPKPGAYASRNSFNTWILSALASNISVVYERQKTWMCFKPNYFMFSSQGHSQATRTSLLRERILSTRLQNNIFFLSLPISQTLLINLIWRKEECGCLRIARRLVPWTRSRMRSSICHIACFVSLCSWHTAAVWWGVFGGILVWWCAPLPQAPIEFISQNSAQVITTCSGHIGCM